jgi:hypothetical protein
LKEVAHPYADVVRADFVQTSDEDCRMKATDSAMFAETAKWVESSQGYLGRMTVLAAEGKDLRTMMDVVLHRRVNVKEQNERQCWG